MMTIRRLLVPAVVVGAAFLATAATQRGSAPDLTKPASVEKVPGADGFIQRWVVLEPIPIQIHSNAPLNDSFVQTTVKTEYFPNQYTMIPRDGDKVAVNGSELMWHAVDTRLYNVNLYHFAYALGKPTSNVLFWAVTVVDCLNELKDVRLAIGSNAASVWWVNGKEVIGIYGDRQSVIDDGVSKRLTLKKGPNVVRCAVINGGGATDFCARFLGKDEVPVKNFVVNLGEAGK
jgi:hypothetical protein